MVINFWCLNRRVIHPHDLLVDGLWELILLISNTYLLRLSLFVVYWQRRHKKLLSTATLCELSFWCSSTLSTNLWLFQIMVILLNLTNAHSYSLWQLRLWRFTERWRRFLSPAWLSIINRDLATCRISRYRGNTDRTRIILRLLGDYDRTGAAATKVLIVILSFCGYVWRPAMPLHGLFWRFTLTCISLGWSWQRLALLDQDCFIELNQRL